MQQLVTVLLQNITMVCEKESKQSYHYIKNISFLYVQKGQWCFHNEGIYEFSYLLFF